MLPRVPLQREQGIRALLSLSRPDFDVSFVSLLLLEHQDRGAIRG